MGSWKSGIPNQDTWKSGTPNQNTWKSGTLIRTHGSQASLIGTHGNTQCPVSLSKRRRGRIPGKCLKLLRQLAQSDHTKKLLKWLAVWWFPCAGQTWRVKGVLTGKKICGSGRQHLAVCSFLPKETKLEMCSRRSTGSCISPKKNCLQQGALAHEDHFLSWEFSPESYCSHDLGTVSSLSASRKS